MKFVVEIKGEAVEFEKFHDMMEYLQNSLAYWNNFINPDLVHQIIVYKVKGDTPTLGISVNEEIDADDLFGKH